MRSAVAAIVVGLTLTACGAPEPSGGAEPPASDGTVPTTRHSPAGAPGPFDPSATMRPDAMVVEPSIVAGGQRFTVTYPGGRERGVAYVLEWTDGAVWHTTHLLTAMTDGYGTEPGSVPFDTETYGWEDIGVAGQGPDELAVPDDVTPGPYRVCTANSAQNICVEIAVVPTDELPIPVEPDGGPGGDAEATIVDVFDGVPFYPACGDEVLEHDGIRWYQVHESEYPELYDRAVDTDREQPPGPAGVHGFARVVAPGPGDDVGTLVVWSDGVALFVSDSGDLRAWLVDVELTYNWVC